MTPNEMLIRYRPIAIARVVGRVPKREDRLLWLNPKDS